MKEKKKIQMVRLQDIEGFQHAKDDYWYRPLVFSKNLFTYVAHIPPGGEMPAHEDAHEFDVSLFMLKGHLMVTYGKEQFRIEANMALYVPGGVPFGVKNDGDITASYVLTFNPPPDISSVEELKETYRKNNREHKSAEEMNKIVGNTLE